MYDLSALSLEQKAGLGSGADFWTTKSAAPVPAIYVTDGPNGVRKQTGSSDSMGIAGSLPATCFPPAVGLSQTWNPRLAEQVGAALGDEAQAANVQVLLGPGVNIKRDPRCGRNFEYFSEDPLLSGLLGAGLVRGLQSRGVGASVKHFAANNAEDDRFRASSDIDERTLREIYLKSFQRVVEDAQPWTVMASYNRINGTFATESRWLLTDVLRDDWGFDGVVVSDWAAVTNRPAAVRAGLDLEMPSTGGRSDAILVAAVRAGEVDEADVTVAAERVALLAERATQARRPDATFDVDAHHALARQVAGQALVLLKNDGDLLPLSGAGSIAVIGEFAVTPRFQAGGSSHVNPTRVDEPLAELRALAAPGSVTFAPGFTTDDSGDASALREEAVYAAAAAETAIVFLGLAELDESEGYDRDHIELPQEQIDLLAAVVAAQPRTVVVLAHGGVVRLADVAELAPAIVDGALLGQAVGGAIADVLFGVVNPSGRLSETVPVRIEDTPAYLSYPGEHQHTLYGERIFVGYRWYDAREIAVTYPFGHGLSYTSFEYRTVDLEATEAGVLARVEVANTGQREGREVVQVYLGRETSEIARAPRTLVGFGDITLEPGESGVVEILIRSEEIAYWDTRVDAWVTEAGEYHVSVGASSRDIRLTSTIERESTGPRLPFTLESTLGDLFADPVAAPIIMEAIGDGSAMLGEEAEGTPLAVRGLKALPIERLVSFAQGRVTRDQVERLIALSNASRSDGFSA